MILLRLAIAVPLMIQPALAAEQTAKFAVSNMTCALCPITVRTAMERVPGVIGVDIDPEAAVADVRYEDSLTSPEAIAQASTDAGYPAAMAGPQ
jgi:mercuric ion binding protein